MFTSKIMANLSTRMLKSFYFVSHRICGKGKECDPTDAWANKSADTSTHGPECQPTVGYYKFHYYSCMCLAKINTKRS